MSEVKNERKAIWIYAVILFTSAFIVLLLTAYSQIKFNNNILDYRNQISNEAKEKNSFQFSLNEALNTNKILQNENITLKEDLKKAQENIESLNNKIKVSQNNNAKINALYEALNSAQLEYLKGNIADCAVMLYNMQDINLLSGQSIALYNKLTSETYKKASYDLYYKGYFNYLQKDYTSSISSLSMSLKFSSTEYYSDDCIYFIAYSYYKQGNMNEAVSEAQKLQSLYKDSNYYNDAGDLIEHIKKLKSND